MGTYSSISSETFFPNLEKKKGRERERERIFKTTYESHTQQHCLGRGSSGHIPNATVRVCVSAHMCVCLSMHMCAPLCVSLCLSVFVYLHVCLCVCVSVCGACVCVSLCVHGHMCLCVPLYMCLCMYVSLGVGEEWGGREPASSQCSSALGGQIWEDCWTLSTRPQVGICLCEATTPHGHREWTRGSPGTGFSVSGIPSWIQWRS